MDKFTLKRISVLFLSFGAMVGYGYMLGGLFGYAFGRGRPLVIAAGFAGGTLAGWLAFKVWRSYMDDISRQEDSPHTCADRKDLTQ